MEEFRVRDLVGYLNGLNNIFDTVRVVNPKIKEVVYENGRGATIIHGTNCYEYWDRGQPCDNCISTRAIGEKKTLTKIKYNGNGVFMVIATPMIFGDDLYIVEMLKDITEIMFSTDSIISFQQEYNQGKSIS